MSRVLNEDLLAQEEALLREPEGSTNVAITPDPVTPEVVAEPEPEKLLRVTTKTGRVYTGKTEEDIREAMLDDLEQAQATPEVRTETTREVRRKLKYQDEHRPPVDDAYDHQKWVNLMFGGPNGEKADPIAAWKYQSRHVLGLHPEEDPVEAFNFMLKRVDKWDGNVEYSEFQRLNSVDGKPFNLSKEEHTLLGNAIKQAGLEVTAMNLNGVYHTLKSHGLIKGPVEAAGSVQYQDIPRRSRGATAPRATGGGSAQQATTGLAKTAADLSTMTAAELQAYMDKLPR